MDLTIGPTLDPVRMTLRAVLTAAEPCLALEDERNPALIVEDTGLWVELVFASRDELEAFLRRAGNLCTNAREVP